MAKLIDITGKRFHDLTVIERAENAPGGVAQWVCLCDCGNYTTVRGVNLKSGAVKSCGCRRHRVFPTMTHNMSKTRLYREWAAIKRRCCSSYDKHNFKNYGGRGIQMCDAWRDSFEAFMKWAIKSGYSDDLTIERIDVNGNYCPENCTFIPANRQQGNRRSCVLITHDGKTQNLVDWCNELKLPYKLIHNRIHKLGWSFEKAISTPVDVKKRNKKNV